MFCCKIYDVNYVCLLQRLPEILNQIFGILNACRNANQRVGNAVLFADFLGYGGVGHYRRNLDETLNTATAFAVSFVLNLSTEVVTPSFVIF